MPDCIIIAHAPIIDAGHIIVETKTETIIRDIGEQYEVRYPKPANSNEWPLLLDVLNQLSNLRRNYPLTIHRDLYVPHKLPPFGVTFK